jgi:predicted dehydrogenase
MRRVTLGAMILLLAAVGHEFQNAAPFLSVLGVSAQEVTPEAPTMPLRVGLIGLDTSHVIAFTQFLNDPGDPDHVPLARVTCAFKGGSPDIEASATRVEGFTKSLKDDYGIEILDSIEALVAQVDAVLLTSLDGRVHLDQVRPVFAAKRRVFIDKPLAASLKDVMGIVRLSKETGTPFFSASSLRFWESVVALKDHPEVGRILGCEAYSPASIEPHHPDLAWYGVHGVETLYALMGPGCESLQRWHTEGADVIVGRWKDGRIATFRGTREGSDGFGATAYGEKGTRSTLQEEKAVDYGGLLREIVKFFQTGVAPVSVEEMVEVQAFMAAADLSKERNGSRVRLDEVK